MFHKIYALEGTYPKKKTKTQKPQTKILNKYISNAFLVQFQFTQPNTYTNMPKQMLMQVCTYLYTYIYIVKNSKLVACRMC